MQNSVQFQTILYVHFVDFKIHFYCRTHHSGQCIIRHVDNGELCDIPLAYGLLFAIIRCIYINETCTLYLNSDKLCTLYNL